MKIRICSACGKHNSVTAWSCANCGDPLSINTIVELDDELVEIVTTPIDEIHLQRTVSIWSRLEPEKNWESEKR